MVESDFFFTIESDIFLQLKVIFFYRFVFLPDCKHVVESDFFLQLKMIFFFKVESDFFFYRFVFLPDCKHVVESDSLAGWMRASGDAAEDAKEIKMVCCPRCTQPIFNCFRLKNFVLSKFLDIQRVQEKSSRLGKLTATKVFSKAKGDICLDNI